VPGSKRVGPENIPLRGEKGSLSGRVEAKGLPLLGGGGGGANDVLVWKEFEREYPQRELGGFQGKRPR